ncbi:efflux RND transporter periplasmic adaptor subunit [Bacillus sp. JJ1532]|uniref:efflux RND transporter periplasmic adaptor subunit n=1 Tax=Bacillus sp. JJ1532 TaxID=3122958 RepID=UPI002FFE97FE
MKKRIKMILAAGVFLLVAGNLFLIVKDHSKIERSAFIKSYSMAVEKDIKETLHKKGIVAPLEDYHYYYDQKMGVFKQFFVKKGETVEVGTPLYEYISADLEADMARIEAEKTKIENQIEVVERHITELRYYKDSLHFDEEEKAVGLSILHSVEQDIYEKELQADLLRQTADKHEQELQDIQANEGEITVVSDFEGIIKEINVGLHNPLITISSAIPTIEGLLNEEERVKVETGIPVVISSKHINGKGMLTKADKLPDYVQSEKESLYPFSIQMDDEVPDLLQGSHVEVTLITKEVNGAIMVPKQSIIKQKKKSFVWVITSGGILEKREIKTGIASGNKLQIESGVEKGELIVNNPASIQQGEGPKIMTPLNLSNIERSEIEQMRKKHIFKHIVKGILIR